MEFSSRESVEQVEEGKVLAPRFDAGGLLPCVTAHAETKEILMVGHMNAGDFFEVEHLSGKQ